MKDILLTGGSGFLGRKLIPALQKKGFTVHAPTRQEMDLLVPESTAQALNAIRPNIVIHAAAVYGGIGLCAQEPEKLFDINVQMHENLFRALGQCTPSRVVGIGSSCAYPGDAQDILHENNYCAGPLHSTVAGFAATKRFLLQQLKALEEHNGTPYQFPILSNLYGDFDSFDPARSHVVAALIKRFVDAKEAGDESVVCWGSGSPERECLFVDDAAEGIARFIVKGTPGLMNIGTGKGVSIRTIALKIAQAVGYKGRIDWDKSKPDGAKRKVLDIEHLRSTLKWEPKKCLDEGLRDTVAWYKANCSLEA